MYDLITNGFLTSLIQSFYEAAIFKVHKLLGVRMLRGHVVLDFWPCPRSGFRGDGVILIIFRTEPKLLVVS